MTNYAKLTDYHVHTGRYHATGRPEDYVEQAIRLGLSEIGFSEHAPLYHLPPDQRDPDLAMAEEAIDAYVEEVVGLRSRYPEITIRLGIEADYVPGIETQIARLGDAYPWDYVLGSVHFLGDWGIDNPAETQRYAEWDIDELYSRYFSLVVAAAETGLYDVMSHLDLVKKFGHLPTVDLTPVYRDVATRLGQAGVATEVSTAGLRKPVQEIYPAIGLLIECRQAGIPIIISSDAHAPQEVGADFAAAIGFAERAGYREVIRLERRARRFEPLRDPLSAS